MGGEWERSPENEFKVWRGLGGQMTLRVWRKAQQGCRIPRRNQTSNKQFSSGTCFARVDFIQTLRFRGQISPAWALQVISLSKKNSP